MKRHLSDDELIARLYGLDGDDGHIDTCAECAARWRVLQIRREEIAEPVGISSAMLSAQQDKIVERLSQPAPALRPRRLIWAPALAAAFLLAMGIFLSQPSPPPQPAPDRSETDMQLFTDVYAMEQTVEPRAAAPVRALFEEEQ